MGLFSGLTGNGILDVIGRLPTPAEARTFLTDASPDKKAAFEKASAAHKH